jgi:hypothetical protein
MTYLYAKSNSLTSGWANDDFRDVTIKNTIGKSSIFFLNEIK